MNTAKEWVKGCRSLCVLTGAGVSAESGVPTFRGAGGLWKRRDPMSLATPEAFAEEPREVWEWYQWRRQKIRECAPNPGHLAIAAVEERKPDFLLVTQNVDGLHRAAGSRRMVEIHGSIWIVRCTGCGREREERADFGTLPPRCGSCGELLRPGVVWFGEMLPPAASEAAMEMLARCELLIVAGTSAVVAPASGYAAAAKRHGARVIEVNPEETPVSGLCDATFRGTSGEILPALLG
jgi:NAD-dependent deacetylase